MKVFTIGVNYASTHNNIAKGLKELGIEVRSLSVENKLSGYNDYSLIQTTNFTGKPLSPFSFNAYKIKYANYKLINEYADWADIIHVFSDTKALPLNIDVQLLRKSGKKCFVHFFGSDIRIPEIELSTNPYFHYVWHNKNYEYCNESEQASLKLQDKFKGFIPIVFDTFIFLNHAIFPTYNLLPHPTIIPDQVNTYEYIQGAPLKIAHAPSAPVAKGTRFIVDAISELQKNVPIDFTLVQNVSVNEYLRIIEGCDIYIDQLIWGAYGVAAQQAMSLGKPVVCYLKPILTEQLFSKDIPIINANPDNIRNVLELLIARPELLQTIGLSTRTYAQNTHHHLKVAQQLLDIYES